MFEELNQMVSDYCQVENEVKKALDTPIKLMQLFRGAKNYLIGEYSKHLK